MKHNETMFSPNFPPEDPLRSEMSRGLGAMGAESAMNSVGDPLILCKMKQKHVIMHCLDHPDIQINFLQTQTHALKTERELAGIPQ